MRTLNILRKALIYAHEEASDKQALHSNAHQRRCEFSVGRRTHPLSNPARYYSAGLEKKYEGPLVITTKLSVTRYELSDLSGKILGQSAVSDLKPWIALD